MNNIGYQIGGGLECIFDTIYVNESKWYPTLIIRRILFFGNTGDRNFSGLGY